MDHEIHPDSDLMLTCRQFRTTKDPRFHKRPISGLHLHTICCPQICQPASNADEPSTDDKIPHLLLSRHPQYDHYLPTHYNDNTGPA
jgi:hypothetical protein